MRSTRRAVPAKGACPLFPAGRDYREQSPQDQGGLPQAGRHARCWGIKGCAATCRPGAPFSGRACPPSESLANLGGQARPLNGLNLGYPSRRQYNPTSPRSLPTKEPLSHASSLRGRRRLERRWGPRRRIRGRPCGDGSLPILPAPDARGFAPLPVLRKLRFRGGCASVQEAVVGRRRGLVGPVRRLSLARGLGPGTDRVYPAHGVCRLPTAHGVCRIHCVLRKAGLSGPVIASTSRQISR
jgi:hypothetical protein